MQTEFPAPGELFQDRYRVERLLGVGGFARVFLAEQTDLGRPVALKVMGPGESRDDSPEVARARHETFVRRFEREAKMISRLRDPRTVVMYDYGRTGSDQLFMVLEYVDGEALDQLVRRTGAVSAERVTRIVEQVLRSLREAHSLGVLHRDIKPSNIMLYRHMDEDDHVKVLDFGIAKPLTATGAAPETELTDGEGMLVGTPRYMSPEQIRGDDLTPSSDIYSLGLVAYELLAGHKAVEEPTTVRIISRHLSAVPFELPANLDCPPRLRKVIEKMLEKDISDRYASTDEVLADLRALEEEEELPVLEVELVEHDERPRERKLIIAAAVALVAVLAVGVIAFVVGRGSVPEADGGVEPQPASYAEIVSADHPASDEEPTQVAENGGVEDDGLVAVPEAADDPDEPVETAPADSDSEPPPEAEPAEEPASATSTKTPRKDPRPRPKPQQKKKTKPAVKFLPVE